MIQYQSELCPEHQNQLTLLQIQNDNIKLRCEQCEHSDSIYIQEAIQQFTTISDNLVNNSMWQLQDEFQLVIDKGKYLYQQIGEFILYVTQQLKFCQEIKALRERVLLIQDQQFIKNIQLIEIGDILQYCKQNKHILELKKQQDELSKFLKNSINQFSIASKVFLNTEQIQQEKIQDQSKKLEVQQNVERANTESSKNQEQIENQEKQINEGLFTQIFNFKSQLTVYCMIFSPDDIRIVTGGASSKEKNKNLMVFKRDNNKLKTEQILYGHQKRVVSLAFNHSSSFFASGSLDNTIRLWFYENKTRSWECIKLLNIHTSTVLGLLFNKKYNELISCSHDKSIIVWTQTNIDEWSQEQILQKHESSVNTLCVLDDGNTFVSGGDDKLIIIWQKKDKLYELIQKIEGMEQSYIYSLQSLSQNCFISGTYNSSLLFWDLNILDGSYNKINEINLNSGYIKKICYHTQLNLIVAKCEHKTIILKFDIQSKQVNQICEYEGEYLGICFANNFNFLLMYHVEKNEILVKSFNI